MLTRRLFAKRAPMAVAAVPMALPSALHQTAGSFGGPMGMPPIGGGMPISDANYQAKYNLFDAARRARDLAVHRQRHEMNLLGGLDADLFALRSIPVTQKARIQAARTIAREEDHQSWTKALAKTFGLNW